MSTDPAPIPPDTRNWLRVLDHGCEECGWQPTEAITVTQALRSAVQRWRTVLARPDAAERPAPQVWSPVEYACHVRDMVRLLGVRVSAMLRERDPQFEDWDGEAKAVELGYHQVAPTWLADDMARHTAATVETLEGVSGGQWDRPGHRSDGVPFTIASLTQYMAHEVAHHLHDVHG